MVVCQACAKAVGSGNTGRALDIGEQSAGVAARARDCCTCSLQPQPQPQPHTPLPALHVLLIVVGVAAPGCSVDGASFELARTFDEVVGLDFSQVGWAHTRSVDSPSALASRRWATSGRASSCTFGLPPPAARPPTTRFRRPPSHHTFSPAALASNPQSWQRSPTAARAPTPAGAPATHAHPPP